MYTRSPASTVTDMPKHPGVLLQRPCDCGTHTPGDGECAACSRKKLQRKATNERSDFEVPESVRAVPNGAGPRHPQRFANNCDYC